MKQFRDHFDGMLGESLVFGYGTVPDLHVWVSNRADLGDIIRFPRQFNGMVVEYRVLDYPPVGVNL